MFILNSNKFPTKLIFFKFYQSKDSTYFKIVAQILQNQKSTLTFRVKVDSAYYKVLVLNFKD
jgi:hypothetical protein